MASAGVSKIRKDAVTGIEIVCSLPPGCTIECQAYFTDCAQWAGQYFGCPILSVVVHHDEGAPHCHVVLLPLVDGRMIGNKLVGHKPVLVAMQKSFFDSVAARYGLRKAPARLTGDSKRDAAKKVMGRLREAGDMALQSQVWATIRDLIEGAPEPFLLALGINTEPRKKPLKTMAEIFTSKGRGPDREPTKSDRRSNTIAFADLDTKRPNTIAFADQKAGNVERLCSGAFAQNPPPSQPPTASSPTPSQVGQPSENWTVDDDGVLHQAAKGGADVGQVFDLGQPEIVEPASQVVVPDPATEVAVSTPIKPKRVPKYLAFIREDTPDGNAKSLAWVLKTYGPKGVSDFHAAQQAVNDATRQRDADYEVTQWSEELGEFVGTANGTETKKTARVDADAWVASELDQYIAMGIPPEKAQRMAASDVLAEIEQEHQDFIKLVAEQHPDMEKENDGHGNSSGGLADQAGRSVTGQSGASGEGYQGAATGLGSGPGKPAGADAIDGKGHPQSDQDRAVEGLEAALRDDGKDIGEGIKADASLPETKGLNALLDAFAGLTGKRGIVIDWVGGSYGMQYGEDFFVNVNDPDFHVAQTIGHLPSGCSHLHPDARRRLAKRQTRAAVAKHN
jgi:hypothetical protein